MMIKDYLIRPSSHEVKTKIDSLEDINLKELSIYDVNIAKSILEK